MDFAAHYRALSDDELEELRADPGQLVPEARDALAAELSVRHISKHSAQQPPNRLAALESTVDEKLDEATFLMPKVAGLFRSIQDWRGFRRHHAHWPLLSIATYIGQIAALFGLICIFFIYAGQRHWSDLRIMLVAVIFVVLASFLFDWVQRRVRILELQMSKNKQAKN